MGRQENTLKLYVLENKMVVGLRGRRKKDAREIPDSFDNDQGEFSLIH